MDILEQRKEYLLTALLRAMALLGAVAYVPSIYACLLEELYGLAVRVAAISAANELLMADPANPKVDLYELLRGMLRAGIDSLKGEGLVLLPPERITEISVGLADIVESLKPLGPLQIEMNTLQSEDSRAHAVIEIQLGGLSSTFPPIESLLDNELLPQNWLITDSTNKKVRISIPSEA
ncbi:MAG: hypothetical protein ACOCZA_07925 [Spirochaetota bacterium]